MTAAPVRSRWCRGFLLHLKGRRPDLRNNRTPLRMNPIFRSYQAVVHERFQRRRLQLFENLHRACENEPPCLSGDGESAVAALVRKLAGCCESPILRIDEHDERLHVSEGRCKSRHCPRCAAKRLGRLRLQIEDLCKQMDDTRFITLTVRSNNRPLREQLKELRESFARLRRCGLWKGSVRGGLYTVEITYNRKKREWHPHIHAIVDGVFIPQALLSEAWEVASSGSTITHISRIPSRHTLAKYLTKYISKGMASDEIPYDRLNEWIIALHGVRLFQAFGSLHGVKPADDEEFVTLSSPRFICHLNPLAYCSIHGNSSAARLLTILTDYTDSNGCVHTEQTQQHLSMNAREFAWRVSDYEKLMADPSWYNSGSDPPVFFRTPTQPTPSMSRQQMRIEFPSCELHRI